MSAGPANLEVISWNNTLSHVYTKMFKLLQERLGDSLYIEGYEITREDFNFPAEVRSNGDLEVADQEFATQKANMRLQVLLNPALAEIVDAEDKYNSVRDWLEKDGVKDPDQFITNPMQIMQTQLAQMKQQMMQIQQQLQASQAELDKNQKDVTKAKRLERKHLNTAEANVEAINQEKEGILMRGAEELNSQADMSENLVGRTADELLRQSV